MTRSVLPVIDVAPLAAVADAAVRVPAAALAVAERIQEACRKHGFFYVTGHRVPAGLVAELADASTEFFALPAADKREIAMERGGRAWRGYFPVGGELTSGRPDLKEGLYFGAELPGDDPRVRAGLPLHGRNLFPRQVPRLREPVGRPGPARLYRHLRRLPPRQGSEGLPAASARRAVAEQALDPAPRTLTGSAWRAPRHADHGQYALGVPGFC